MIAIIIAFAAGLALGVVGHSLIAGTVKKEIAKLRAEIHKL